MNFRRKLGKKMNKELIEALKELEKEKGIPMADLLEALKAAMASAYKKRNKTVAEKDDKKKDDSIEVDIDPETGEITITELFVVVADEDYVDPKHEIPLSEALEGDPDSHIGDQVGFEVDFDVNEFGRVAAQAAKQLLNQKIREAERAIVYNNYIDRVGDIMTGRVQRKKGDTIYINLGHVEGVLPAKEQVEGERYRPGDKLKVFVMDVKATTKGAQIFLSRSHPGLVRKLFELEVPEIGDGTVEIKGIAREAGSRTKIAVYTADPNVDPIGACVGARGTRVQNIVDELYNEKIDIINWKDDPYEMIENVLAPAKVDYVYLNNEEKMATVVVPEDQLSLAIGKSGQNARLAAKLCNWKIDIHNTKDYFGEDGMENVLAKREMSGEINADINEADETVEEVASEE